MKKILVALVLALGVAALIGGASGCGGGPTTAPKTSTPSTK